MTELIAVATRQCRCRLIIVSDASVVIDPTTGTTRSIQANLLGIADSSTWTNSYLAALEQAGLLRPEDERDTFCGLVRV